MSGRAREPLGAVCLEGRGLHTGAACAVEIRASATPVCFAHGARLLSRRELEVVGCDRGVRVAHTGSGFELELVEHLFAALGGLSIQAGVTISVAGPEVPLLGGGSLEIAQSLLGLALPPAPPQLVVCKRAALAHSSSVYEFEPSCDVGLEVAVEYPETGPEAASWHGDRGDFLERIAPARTFGFLREAALLFDSGRARHVDPQAVLVFDAQGGVVGSSRPPGPAELARHKLLDLIGDLYLYGGPPLGRLRASRPGHRATHAVVRQALAEGILDTPAI